MSFVATGPVRAGLSGFALALLASCVAAPPVSPTVQVNILALNDFHGNLEAPARVSLPDPERPGAMLPERSGGAARLATLAAELAARSPNTVMVAAGDLIGASPLLSSLFHDEPTIESLSMMGLALSAVGNHEFDEGADELRRMQAGGCHPVDGCMGPAPFKGATFRYLAAGAIDTSTGQTVFPPYEVREFDGVKVGFIGLTLKTTPSLLAPSAREGLEFRDEAETINTHASALRGQGVQAIVVMIHEGGYPSRDEAPCEGMSGPIMDIVPKVDRAVDLFVTGHTHMAYTCRIDGRLVTSAGRFGTMLTDIALTLDRGTGEVTASEARNVVVRPDRAEDAAQTAMIGAYKALAAPLMDRPAGSLAEPLPNAKNAAGESAVGLVIADAMRETAAAAIGGRVDLALMNPGGVRAAFDRAGEVTYGDIFTVQPFGNDIVVLTLTGAEIEAVLNQQFGNRERGDMILHPSDGFGFRWRAGADGAGALVPGSATLNGAPLQADAAYRVATNNFLASGGDSFTAFSAGKDRVLAGGDAAALAAYIRAHAPVAQPVRGRVVKE